MTRRWTVICQEIPYPPRHGGRVDMWRRLQVLKLRGVSIHLVCWSDTEPPTTDQRVLETICERVDVLLYRKGMLSRAAQLPLLLRYPAPVGTRWVNKSRMELLVEKMRDFGSQLVIQDGLMGGVLAARLASMAKVPLFVRSHNIEHLYWGKQLVRAHGRDKLMVAGRLFGIKRFEFATLSRADRFFDISVDDLRFWESKGLTHGRWLPPMVAESSAAPSPTKPDFDVGFVGNLRMPNNIEGLRWFFSEVIPHAEKILGRIIRILVAGSSPTKEVHSFLKGRVNVELIANFEDLDVVFGRCRVLVNPMLVGSGVALKTVDMLLSGRPTVSTNQGVTGLPDSVRSFVSVADDPAAFGRFVAEQVKSGGFQYYERQHSFVAELFGPKSVNCLIEEADIVASAASREKSINA